MRAAVGHGASHSALLGQEIGTSRVGACLQCTPGSGRIRCLAAPAGASGLCRVMHPQYYFPDISDSVLHTGLSGEGRSGCQQGDCKGAQPLGEQSGAQAAAGRLRRRGRGHGCGQQPGAREEAHPQRQVKVPSLPADPCCCPASKQGVAEVSVLLMLSNLAWAFAACRPGLGCMDVCVAVARQHVSWVCQQ